ncbi:MAG: VCBS repeat-containing protein [Planctomycetes bacterium]|nr:VCBS repeat-containing protein [Planctomycetota bacterium]
MSHRLLWFPCTLALCAPALRSQTPLPSRDLRPDFQLHGWTIPASDLSTTCFAELDVDGDGDLDLFVGAAYEEATIWLRDGDRFVEAQERIAGALPWSTRAIARDFDGDGYRDLYVARAPAGPFVWPGPDVTAGWDRFYVNRLDPRTGERRLVDANWNPSGSFLDALQDPSQFNVPHPTLSLSSPFYLAVSEIRYTHDVLARDLDGDGDLDLVLAHGLIDPQVRRGLPVEGVVHGMENAVYWNVGDTNGDGVPNFVDAGSLHHDDPDTGVVEDALDVTFAVEAHDWDGDGDLDLVFGNFTNTASAHVTNVGSGACNRYYEAVPDGRGSLRWVNRTYRMFGPQAPCEETRALRVADVDPLSPGPELWVVNYQDARALGGEWHPDRLYAFDPLTRVFRERVGFFAQLAFAPDELHANTVLFDEDGDGDLDALVLGPRPRFLENRAGRFLASTVVGDLALPHEAATAIALDVDLDGDGHADPGVRPRWVLMGCLAEQSRLLAVAGTHVFRDHTVSHLPVDLGDTEDLHRVDVDQDGHGDLLLARGERGIGLWLGGPSLRFDEAPGRFSPPPRHPVALAVADFDGVQGPDVFVLERDGRHALYVNDGTGVFLATGSLPGDPALGRAIHRGSVLLHDVDGDGLDDLLSIRCANVGGLPAPLPVLCWKSLGQGLFQDARQVLPASGSIEVAASDGLLTDVNDDGELDLFIASDSRVGPPLQLWCASGTGTFVDRSHDLPPLGRVPLSAAAEDLNGDGFPDLYVGIQALEHPGRAFEGGVLLLSGPDLDGDGVSNYRLDETHDLVRLQPGTGTLPRFLISTVSPQFVDLDGDGDLDFVAVRTGAASVCYERLGRRRWSLPRPFTSPHASSFRRAVLFDANGDGSEDLFLSGSTQSRLFLNPRAH